jgi:molybdenum cofactor guanylyltransferase
MEIASVILAGGKNLRIGKNKALEIIAGKSLLRRVYDKVRQVSGKVIIVTSQEFTEIPEQFDAQIVPDIYPEKGPLGGIYTGLKTSGSPVNLIAACDMPFMNIKILKQMIEVIGDADAVVPRMDRGMIEPLHAVYSGNCLGIIEDRIKQNKLSIHAFIDVINVRYFEKEESLRFDPELVSFFDINYQSDMDRAAVLAEKLDTSE